MPVAGAPRIPSYYRNTTFSTVRGIRYYCNRGAIAAGRSPGSVIILSMVSTEFKESLDYWRLPGFFEFCHNLGTGKDLPLNVHLPGVLHQ